LWAQDHDVQWAFSDRNAGAYLAKFYNRSDDLDRVNWSAVQATDFRDMVIKEAKQAEFLVYDTFPWGLVERIGVLDRATARTVATLLENADHLPGVRVEPTWYY